MTRFVPWRQAHHSDALTPGTAAARLGFLSMATRTHAISVARQRIAYFCALIAVALGLGPSLAHLLELPNKIGLGEDAYFTVQAIYRGWAMLAIVVVVALVSTAALALLLRRRRRPMAWALAAFGCLVGAQALFWTFTYPANQATDNWTVVPADWQLLRSQWEYSHAAAAVLNLAAMVALVCSLLSWSGNRAQGAVA
jgi:hypothetical protein